MQRLALLALLSASVCGSPLLLKEAPYLMAHDAATGYLYGRKVSIVQKIIDNWAVTQTGNFTEQLNCGANSFDVRPYVDTATNNVYLHHGKIDVKVPLASVVDEVTAWAHAQPASTPPVLLVMAECGGTNCTQRVRAILKTAGVAAVECSEMPTLTYAAALKRGKVLGFPDGCTSDNYEVSVTCYPPYKYNPPSADAAVAAPSLALDCYGSDKFTEPAFVKMGEYLNVTTAMPFSSFSGFSQAQALWQETAATVTEGVLHGSSLLKDETRSQVNSWVADNLVKGYYPNLSLLEVNDVCNGGPRLQGLLAKRLSKLLKEE
eukprot:Rhum_TRINITY_DN20808_c0_g1::Rhum_TRINITY_DN20808_c0_g1_i1::g.172225::m.172225